MKIFLSKRAIKDYQSVKEFIANKWGVKVSEAYEQKINHFLDLLEDFPEIGSLEVPERKIYGFQLTRQTRVFYRIKYDRIIILSFFDVRQNPAKRNM